MSHIATELADGSGPPIRNTVHMTGHVHVRINATLTEMDTLQAMDREHQFTAYKATGLSHNSFARSGRFITEPFRNP